MYCGRTTPRYSMDYFANLPNLICSILELTTPRTAGRLRVVPLFSLAWRRRGEDFEKKRRMGEDFERMEEDGEEDGHRTFRGRKRDFEKEKKGERESCDSIAVFW